MQTEIRKSAHLTIMELKRDLEFSDADTFIHGIANAEERRGAAGPETMFGLRVPVGGDYEPQLVSVSKATRTKTRRLAVLSR